MKYLKYYTILLFFIINVLEINCKFLNISKKENSSIINNEIRSTNKIIHKRANNGTAKCRKLPNKHHLKLSYYSYSLFRHNNVVSFYNCYYEPSFGIVVCNELTARYIYIFYLPIESLNDNYGYNINNPKESCSVENSTIIDWKFFYNSTADKYDFLYTYTHTKDREEHKKYTFEITFSNNCHYILPVQRVDYKKALSLSHCKSKYQ
ncbi:hypothetical protein BCR32DRAFT_286577 [Anaeromyces robustus]|uniref:Uncharacterized protein n=1 Tax=Anaeromyces robustus TaxID=1754192 RepID=A0A1Y1VVU3_9FUNG|nr:hypothetical protein BCR32DRAFT_286577 [Anaeromyces robustus]|eukprot:ORX65323.1 hypothetical protein BCR32DRAFT_286577 [Anaeromyces robustus]